MLKSIPAIQRRLKAYLIIYILQFLIPAGAEIIFGPRVAHLDGLNAACCIPIRLSSGSRFQAGYSIYNQRVRHHCILFVNYGVLGFFFA